MARLRRLVTSEDYVKAPELSHLPGAPPQGLSQRCVPIYAGTDMHDDNLREFCRSALCAHP